MSEMEMGISKIPKIAKYETPGIKEFEFLENLEDCLYRKYCWRVRSFPQKTFSIQMSIFFFFLFNFFNWHYLRYRPKSQSCDGLQSSFVLSAKVLLGISFSQ